jgi:hypothetical protein
MSNKRSRTLLRACSVPPCCLVAVQEPTADNARQRSFIVLLLHGTKKAFLPHAARKNAAIATWMSPEEQPTKSPGIGNWCRAAGRAVRLALCFTEIMLE